MTNQTQQDDRNARCKPTCTCSDCTCGADCRCSK
jgi:hypothetical protein